jgi:Flp pilus assembly pilin Flp
MIIAFIDTAIEVGILANLAAIAIAITSLVVNHCRTEYNQRNRKTTHAEIVRKQARRNARLLREGIVGTVNWIEE